MSRINAPGQVVEGPQTKLAHEPSRQNAHASCRQLMPATNARQSCYGWWFGHEPDVQQNKLEQLRDMSVIAADTGDIESIRSHAPACVEKPKRRRAVNPSASVCC